MGITLTLRGLAENDPTMLARNAAGHWDDCNYGDWGDFSKCNCAEGLASTPAKSEAVTVAPLPLRDYFAATVPVPWDDAVALASAENAKRVALGGQITLLEIVEARVRLRYLEADMMIAVRALPPARVEADEPTPDDAPTD